MVMAAVGRFALALLGLLFMLNLALGNPDTTEIDVICNINHYGSGDPYANSVSYVLEDMATMTANQPGFDYHTVSRDAKALVWGHSCCRAGSVSITDCATCIGVAKSNLENQCPMSIGAQVLLQDCAMRYENYPLG